MKDFKDLTNVAVVGIVCIVGGIIYKKLRDIHEEIIYFEDMKGLWYSKKAYYDTGMMLLQNETGIEYSDDKKLKEKY